jgi:hypothetical protein
MGDIGGLKKVYWNGSSSKRALYYFMLCLFNSLTSSLLALIEAGIEPLWHILSRSLTTLHTISLPFDLYLDGNNDQLWDMHFPHLRSLSIGSWIGGFQPRDTDFLDFLLAHSKTVEVLDLEYDGFDEDVFMFNDFYRRRFQTTSLPHLSSFRGHPSILVSLARARISSLATTLRQQAVGRGDMQEMFDTMAYPDVDNGPAVGALWALQEIELDLYDWVHHQHDEVIGTISQCANYCPSVEVWKGTVPGGFSMDAEMLCEAFARFRGLREVYLHSDNILGPASERSREEDEEDEGEGEENEEEE